jgi:hypothetical protein
VTLSDIVFTFQKPKAAATVETKAEVVEKPKKAAPKKGLIDLSALDGLAPDVLAIWLDRQSVEEKQSFMAQLNTILRIVTVVPSKPCTCGATGNRATICYGCKCKVSGVDCTSRCACRTTGNRAKCMNPRVA